MINFTYFIYSCGRGVVSPLRNADEEKAENGFNKIALSEMEILRLIKEGWNLVREPNGDRFLMIKSLIYV